MKKTLLFLFDALLCIIPILSSPALADKNDEIMKHNKDVILKNDIIFSDNGAREFQKCPSGLVRADIPCLGNKYKKFNTLIKLNDNLEQYEKLHYLSEIQDFLFIDLCTDSDCPFRNVIQNEQKRLKSENDKILDTNKNINQKNQIILSEIDEIQRENKTIDTINQYLNNYNLTVCPIKSSELHYIIPDGDIIRLNAPLIKNLKRSDIKGKPLLNEWDFYLNHDSKVDNQDNKNFNQKAKLNNQNKEKNNQKIHQENEKIRAENKKKLSEIKAYLTKDILTNLLSDYYENLNKYCISCDDQDMFITIETDCQKCPNREWTATKENKLKGYCKLKQGEK